MRRGWLALAVILLAAAGAQAQEGDGIRVEVLAEATRSWNGRALPAYPEGRPEITILRIHIPPGARLPPHEHPVINAGVLLEGALTVVTEAGETLRLKAGQSIVEVVDTWHHGWNPGDETAVILVFYAGVEGNPITVKKPAPGRGAPAPPPRDPRRPGP